MHERSSGVQLFNLNLPLNFLVILVILVILVFLVVYSSLRVSGWHQSSQRRSPEISLRCFFTCGAVLADTTVRALITARRYW
jgi:hypothetical protein